MEIGIDFGGASAKAGVLLAGKILGKASCATSCGDSVESTVGALATLCRAVCDGASLSLDKVEGIGIGFPGVIDSQHGIVVRWSNFGWKNIPLKELLERELRKPVSILNDANAAALGEAKFGAGAHFRDSIFITLGTGIGGGIVLNGSLYEGYKSAGAEIGHMVIRGGGKKCSCGRLGCFETYASTRALVSTVEHEISLTPEGALAQIAKKDGVIDGKTLFKALESEDARAKEIFSEYIAALGDGIVNLANIFRPQAIVIGGGISAEGERLMGPLREYVRKGLYVSEDYAPLALLQATLGNDAGIFGAAEFAREKVS